MAEFDLTDKAPQEGKDRVAAQDLGLEERVTINLIKLCIWHDKKPAKKGDLSAFCSRLRFEEQGGTGQRKPWGTAQRAAASADHLLPN